MRRLLRWGIAAVAVAAALAGLGLWWAHVSLRGERVPLPEPSDVPARLAQDAVAPTSLTWINSASQDMPRSAVLEPDRDPKPDEPYRMSHPSFVLEWPDGRLLLVDVGMREAAAREFGKPSEWAVDASPMEPHGSTAEQLGPRAANVAGVIFSHLHEDHVEGVAALCEGRDTPLLVFGTEAQLTRPNYTTRPGLRMLGEAPCVELVPLEGTGPLLEVPGFEGIRVIAAAGHTPGSQIVVARVGNDDLFAFTGDVVNAIDGVRHDVPKPWWYSTFLIPEDSERLGEVRRFLRSLEQDQNATLLVQHDELSNEASGVPRWTSPD